MAASRGRGLPFAVAALAALATGALGAWLTVLSPWYYALRNPPWKPPDWLFGPAWTTIFTLAAIAGGLAWNGATSRSERFAIVAAFAVNIALNLLWSGLFFRLHRPDWSLYEVGALWLSIVAMIVVVRRTSTPAAWMLAPYLAWVTFASALNFAIVRLNAPFT
ncbi:MAG: TspO/MBR family protein [Burkholderiales bacterium]